MLQFVTAGGQGLDLQQTLLRLQDVVAAAEVQLVKLQDLEARLCDVP